MYKFIISSTNQKNWLRGHSKEVCFIGRSNVGKSTLINSLTNQKQLAKVSNTPGRTQQINFFQDDKKRTLVDLPGYGYAKMPKAMKQKMIIMIEDYFLNRKELIKAFVLIDSKVGPTIDDVLMLESLKDLGINNMIILTKTDKTNQSEFHKTIEKIKNLGNDWLPISSFNGQNISKLKKIILSIL